MEPEQIEKRDFLVSLRGYDREEVDAFLREVAEEFRKLQSMVGSAPLETVRIEPQAGPAAERSPDAAEAYRRIGEETAKILVAAEQVAAEMKTKGQREAAELIAEARAEADEVARRSEEQRAKAEEDMRSLHDARAMLATQLEDVARRLHETISRLQATAPQQMPAAPKPKLAAQPIAATLEAEARKKKTADQTPATKPAPAAEPAKPIQAAPPPVTEPSAAEPPPVPEAKEAPSEATATAGAPGAAELSEIFDEIQRERQEARREVAEALADEGDQRVEQVETPPVADAAPASVEGASNGSLSLRTDRLKDGPALAARRMKRVLQEDQNDLLDRIRTKRGKGAPEDNMPSLEEQVARFMGGLSQVLTDAFTEGRLSAGAADGGDPGPVVQNLITKQVVGPLRAEITKTVAAGIEAQDTPTSIAERSGDIFRVWKGIRTELLGEGLVYSAYHQGLMDAWKSLGAETKRWVFSEDERDCPRGVCQMNAGAGGVPLGSPFPSGHLAPPAHGGCTCTIEKA